MTHFLLLHFSKIAPIHTPQNAQNKFFHKSYYYKQRENLEDLFEKDYIRKIKSEKKTIE